MAAELVNSGFMKQDTGRQFEELRQQPPGSAPECDAQTRSRFKRKRVRRAPGEVSCQSDRILI
jgi:hypothetical protein